MYRVKKVGNKYKIYNTKRKAYLKKKYSDRAAANRGKTGLLKRVESVRAYHGCCKANNCGKAGRTATNNTTTSNSRNRASSSASSSSSNSRNSSRNSSRSNSRASNSSGSSSRSNVARRREEQPRASTATQDMLSELDNIANTIRTPARPPRNTNRRRIRPIAMSSLEGATSDFGVTSATPGQRRTRDRLEELSKRASNMDRLMSGIVFTT
jgi:hypothetical protein